MVILIRFISLELSRTYRLCLDFLKKVFIPKSRQKINVTVADKVFSKNMDFCR